MRFSPDPVAQSLANTKGFLIGLCYANPTDAYLAEVVDDNVFDELAIVEIVVVGRPVTPTTGTTAPAGTTGTTVPETGSTTGG